MRHRASTNNAAGIDCVTFMGWAAMSLGAPHRWREVADFFHNEDPLHDFVKPSFLNTEYGFCCGVNSPPDVAMMRTEMPEFAVKTSEYAQLAAEADRLGVTIDQAKAYFAVVRKYADRDAARERYRVQREQRRREDLLRGKPPKKPKRPKNPAFGDRLQQRMEQLREGLPIPGEAADPAQPNPPPPIPTTLDQEAPEYQKRVFSVKDDPPFWTWTKSSSQSGSVK